MMLLSTLLQNDHPIPTAVDLEIDGLASDSRLVKNNDVFFALAGNLFDGRHYINDAIGKGAKAIIIDAEGTNIQWQDGVPIIPVKNLAHKIATFAARFYHHPAQKLRMMGVTGTNGKTSCTHFIAQLLQANHVSCGLIGTLGCGFYGNLKESSFTTPDPITLQATLQQFATQGAKAVAMEVSSHSIEQGRINAIDFDIGIFTNLTQDHLDYHGDMQTYAAVKRRFIAELPTKQVVINAEDDYGLQWIKELHATKTIFAYSKKPIASFPSHIPAIFCERTHYYAEGIQAYVHTPWGAGELRLSLMGPFNLSNSLAALAALCVYGIPFETVLHELANLRTVPGRMQMFKDEGKPTVVVDYSHTPDALKNALLALRAHTQDKLICVFGCGGDRDRGKRPLMAKIAEQLADQIIVTNDNPRHENPEAIAQEIMQGFVHPEKVLLELDRSKAIENSIQWAKSADCILVAGKGAERYQQLGDQKLLFDDRDEVDKYLKQYRRN